MTFPIDTQVTLLDHHNLVIGGCIFPFGDAKKLVAPAYYREENREVPARGTYITRDTTVTYGPENIGILVNHDPNMNTDDESVAENLGAYGIVTELRYGEHGIMAKAQLLELIKRVVVGKTPETGIPLLKLVRAGKIYFSVSWADRLVHKDGWIESARLWELTLCVDPAIPKLPKHPRKGR